MAGSISILCVDDNPGDLRLAETMLSELLEDADVRTAGDAEEALERLATADVDCVVSDYDMPGRNGLELLQAVREENPEMPFILFTGKGSEEVASEAISAGVTDYQPKETGREAYELLANRIRNAVESSARKSDLERVRERFQALTETGSFAVVTIDQDGTIRYASDAVEDVLGYEPEEVVGRDAREFVAERARAEFDRAIDRLEGNSCGDTRFAEIPVVRADGEETTLGVTFGENRTDGRHLVTAIVWNAEERERRRFG